MFLKKRNVNGVLYWSIAENYREDGKVKQKVIKNLGNTEKAIESLKNSAEYKEYLAEIYKFKKDDNRTIEINKIHNLDCREGLNLIPKNYIDCCVTSPPYWALRDYGVDGQLGLEKTIEEYINNLCNVFDDVWKVLKNEGSLWVNLGDTYAGSGKGAWANKNSQKEVYVPNKKYKMEENLPDKCLCMIPERFALEMIKRGWILRNKIIWHKPNAMPSSVKDRFTVDYEIFFFFVKQKKYYFDTQYEELKHKDAKGTFAKNKVCLANPQWSYSNNSYDASKYQGRIKRSVWSINTKPFKESHFAVFPPELIETPIKACCPKDGIVLDPFMGSGTTAEKSIELGRNFIGFELNPEYIEIANNHRLNEVQLNII